MVNLLRYKVSLNTVIFGVVLIYALFLYHRTLDHLLSVLFGLSGTLFMKSLMLSLELFRALSFVDSIVWYVNMEALIEVRSKGFMRRLITKQATAYFAVSLGLYSLIAFVVGSWVVLILGIFFSILMFMASFIIFLNNSLSLEQKLVLTLVVSLFIRALFPY